MIGDDDPLNLGCSLVDGEDARIAVIALHGIFLCETVSTMELDGMGRDAVDHLGGEELGHRGLQGVVRAVVFHLGRGEHEQPGGFDLRCHVGDPPADSLELGDLLAELFPFLNVSYASIQRRLGHSDRLGGAGLDVLSLEPPAVTNPLLQAPNCVITPHIAWATRAARRRLITAVAANVAALLAGSPEHVVNPG